MSEPLPEGIADLETWAMASLGVARDALRSYVRRVHAYRRACETAGVTPRAFPNLTALVMGKAEELLG